MTNALHIPCQPLMQYIECLWHVNLRVPYVREKILPVPHLELMFNFGAPFKVYDRDDEARYSLNTRSWVCGVQSGYILNEPLAETHMIGIRFKPGGAYPFLGVSLAEVTNRLVDLDLLWGREAELLREQLYHARDAAQRFALLEAFLLRRLNEPPAGWVTASHAAGHILQAGGGLGVRALSQEMHVSQKHLIHLFKEAVGVSPKLFARIVRFRRALGLINPAHPVPWTALAHQAGYYDQAHFNREFAAFAGLAPGDYLRLRQEHLGPVAQGEDTQFVPLAG